MVAAGTLYTHTLTNANSFSSGPIDVTGIPEIMVFCYVIGATVTADTWFTVNLARIDPFGNVNLYQPVIQLDANNLPAFPAFLVNQYTSWIGNNIQISLIPPDGVSTISMQLSVTGK